jgi:hypothetical protein
MSSCNVNIYEILYHEFKPQNAQDTSKINLKFYFTRELYARIWLFLLRQNYVNQNISSIKFYFSWNQNLQSPRIDKSKYRSNIGQWPATRGMEIIFWRHLNGVIDIWQFLPWNYFSLTENSACISNNSSTWLCWYGYMHLRTRSGAMVLFLLTFQNI